MNKFVHLHNHGEHSYLDGMCKYIELIKRAKELGQTAIAITEHGNCDGIYKFQELCKEEGIKYILGEEFYYLNGYDESFKPIRGHLIVLCKNDIGIKNLYKLQERSYGSNFYRKPMITFEDLVDHHEGLIVLSACLANSIPQYLMKGEYSNARKEAKQFKELLGEDYFLEVQSNSLMEQFNVNKEIVSLSHELDIPLVLTNDTHYVFKEDADVHEVVLAISTQKKMDNPKRWKFPSKDFWLKSEEEMINTVRGVEGKDLENAINNTSIIAKRCNAEIKPGHFNPRYPFLEEGLTAKEQLCKEAFTGLREKGIDDKVYRQEMFEEIECIDRNDYSDYFLIVQDYIKRARDAGILVGDGRGSGAGSKTCYALDITRVEPKEYDLLFERFMADGREPDIDTDFSDIDAVFELLGEAYGWENVSRIISYGTLAPRAVTRKVLSIFNHPMWIVNKICKLIPEQPGLKWEEVLLNEKYVKEISKYEREWQCIQRLQGNISHTSMHAGGILIQNPLSDVVPVKLIKNNKGERIKRVCCFDMDMLHNLHHIKFDLLGLSTLITLELALKNVEKLHNKTIDLTNIDYEDKEIIQEIAEGDVFGIFQLADQPRIAKMQRPQNFRDIIAYEAIIRPGDYSKYYDKRNRIVATEDLSNRPWLKETYGEYVYQEQYLLDCKYFAGWTIAYADKNVRKNYDIINDHELEQKFISDSLVLHPYLNENYLKGVWWEIQKAVASGYSFNKSHACCYGKISMQEAHIRHYYPTCFFSAYLTKHGDDKEKVGEIINECKSRGIQITPPDINRSGDEFVPSNGGIAYRLSSIDGIGETALKEIIRLRPITGLADLLERRQKSKLKSNNIVSLIKSGCFDFEEPDRNEVLHQFRMAQRSKTQVKRGDIVEYDRFDRARWELESLGIFLTEHILDRYAFKSLSSQPDGSEVLVAGIVTGVRVFCDKHGKDMCFCTISNQYESIKLIFFSSTWNEEYKSLCVENRVIYAKGKRQGSDVLVNKAELIEDL